jgi:predicted transcriptional regulator
VQQGDRALLLQLTGEIVATACAGHPAISPSDLPPLIASVFVALRTAGRPNDPPAAALTPAVPVRKSVQPNFLVCLRTASG